MECGNCSMSQQVPFGTCRILRADEDVGRLGQPLHKLSNTLRVVLSLAQ